MRILNRLSLISAVVVAGAALAPVADAAVSAPAGVVIAAAQPASAVQADYVYHKHHYKYHYNGHYYNHRSRRNGHWYYN